MKKKKEMVIYHRQSENHSFKAQAFLTPRGLLLDGGPDAPGGALV